MPAISVVIPTYRRTHDLRRCLRALRTQIRAPDEVLLVVRDTDEETRSFLEAEPIELSSLRIVAVTEPGQVAALNAGLRCSSGEIVAITDDDAAPRSDWLLRIENHFVQDAALGGIGGRDWIPTELRRSGFRRARVGKVQWFGRVIGNHHLGDGKPRYVDFLKGANMSYRRTAIEGIRFHTGLKGVGAQVNNDMEFSMAVKRAGWKLLYDPLVAIDHYPASRFDEDQRHAFNEIAMHNRVHNETYVLLLNFGALRRMIFMAWLLTIGTRASPGLLQWVRLLVREPGLANGKWMAALRGTLDGYRAWRACGDNRQARKREG
ncbi:glycosyltransferase family 2 protein [Cohnella fermenti]|uniref:Glycosyltransferase family 2 protein n=2 Tax=Cohnella fermenti TaxID=2565925 RepID=A0A4V3WE54_9BACL|nr:glycosyltransferase family 2 protein [Cohnella fermenti]THF74909.1 glycosyltransferase family 2 protein [Cohnella fermenti]